MLLGWYVLRAVLIAVSIYPLLTPSPFNVPVAKFVIFYELSETLPSGA
jgi:hypothetical protein